MASPTPMVPISGDSMTVIAIPVPRNARASMLADSQPAVPPPTMTMERILRSLAASPLEAIVRCEIPVIRKVTCQGLPGGAGSVLGTALIVSLGARRMPWKDPA